MQDYSILSARSLLYPHTPCQELTIPQHNTPFHPLQTRRARPHILPKRPIAQIAIPILNRRRLPIAPEPTPLQHWFQWLAHRLAGRHSGGVRRVIVETVLRCVFHVEEKPVDIIVHGVVASGASALAEEAVLHFLALRGVGVPDVVADEVGVEGEGASAVGVAGRYVGYFYCGGTQEEEGGKEEEEGLRSHVADAVVRVSDPH